LIEGAVPVVTPTVKIVRCNGLDQLKLGNRDKKVLLVITDGEDNSSRYTLEELLRYAQKSNAVIYTIGLLGDEEPGGYFKIKGGSAHRAEKFLRNISEATGGEAFFPKNLDETEQICEQIAHDIRNQYTIGYKPVRPQAQGGYRTIKVDAHAPGYKRLMVRTRSGYYPGQERAAK
jgi:Ca-activated chloride channel family protein